MPVLHSCFISIRFAEGESLLSSTFSVVFSTFLKTPGNDNLYMSRIFSTHLDKNSIFKLLYRVAFFALFYLRQPPLNFIKVYSQFQKEMLFLKE